MGRELPAGMEEGQFKAGVDPRRKSAKHRTPRPGGALSDARWVYKTPGDKEAAKGDTAAQALLRVMYAKRPEKFLAHLAKLEGLHDERMARDKADRKRLRSGLVELPGEAGEAGVVVVGSEDVGEGRALELVRRLVEGFKSG